MNGLIDIVLNTTHQVLPNQMPTGTRMIMLSTEVIL